MDHTRKLLLLLESDPKAYSLPLVGVWVSGPFTIHHPYIWSTCVRFLHCSGIQERVLASPNAFLLVHYSPAQSSPVFWECSPQVQLDEGLFELYSSYENLHLDQISSPKYTEPLCFELLSAGDTMNRALFNQAVSTWTKRDQSHPNEDPSPSEKNAMVENNIVSLEPRPSPLPHPQTTRSPLLLPSVPEVSLSLSFDESTFSDQNPSLNGVNQNRQVLPTEKQPRLPGKDSGRILPKRKDDQDVWKRNSKIQDQENRGDPRQIGKQVLVDGAPIISPQREPLKPITGQANQVQKPTGNGSHVPESKVHVVPTGKGRAQNKVVNGGHSKAPGNVPKVKGHPNKGPKDDGINGKGRGSTMKPRENRTSGVKGKMKEMQDAGAQLKPVMTIQGLHEELRVPVIGQQDQRKKNHAPHGNYVPCEGVDEVDSQMTDGNDMIYEQEERVANNNRQRIPDNEATQIPRVVDSRQKNPYTSDAGINDDENTDRKLLNLSKMPQIEETRLFHQHHPGNDEGINSRHIESEMDTFAFCDSGVGDSTRNTAQPEEDSDEFHEESFSYPKRPDPASSFGEKDTVNETRQDPYDLIMKQQQQLKELQQQINLLLLQQSLTQNSPVGIPTPPPTPASPVKPRELSSPVRPRDVMVTMGTNTEASLLMGSAVVGRSKVSVGTSPMRDDGRNEEKHCRLRSHKSCSSTSEATANTFPSHYHPDDPVQSLDGTTDEDELDEKGLVIEKLDDTNRTLASSIHGVDICEFVGSPESTRGQRRSIDSSPVLGESASMMIQRSDEQKHHHEEHGTKTPDEDHNRFESLLYKNERLFYDNLLFKVNQLLCEKLGDSEKTPNTSHDAAPSNQQETKMEENVFREPTRQEVLTATVKEIERIKENNMADDLDDERSKPRKVFQKSNDATFRSSFVDILREFPRINYTSMSVNETLDETVLDTETIALKYLNQDQIQEYRQSASNRHGNLGRGLPRALNNIGSFQNGQFVNDVDCTWNNLSMATQDYLQRYNLVACKKPTNRTRNGENHVTSTQIPGEWTRDRHMSSTLAADRSREGSVASIQCSAPPSTPEPRQTETRILDIQRLRNLPKLL